MELSNSKIKKKNPFRKNFLYFGKWNFLCQSLKNFLKPETCKACWELVKPEKQTKKSALKKFLVFLLHNIKNLYSRMMKVFFLLIKLCNYITSKMIKHT